MHAPRKSVWLKLLALAMSTVFALLAAELLLRCFWHNPYTHEEPDRIVKLRLQHADAVHLINRKRIDASKPIVPFRIDQRSYIKPSFQFENPDCTIAFLGGSTTECCAVDEPLRFPAMVSTELEKLGIRASTLNAGTSGNVMHDSINNLINHVVQDDPDIVVVMHACNDIGLLSREGNYDLRSAQYVGWAKVGRSVAMKLTNYSHVLGITRQVLKEHTHFVPTAPAELEARPALERSASLDGAFEKRLRGFIRVARAFDVEPVIMTQPISSHFTELTPDWVNRDMQTRFNQIVREVGKEEDVVVIDLVKHLKETTPDWDRHLHVFYDGIHVTDLGSQIYASRITQALVEMLRDPTYQERRASIELAKASSDERR